MGWGFQPGDPDMKVLEGISATLGGDLEDFLHGTWSPSPQGRNRLRILAWLAVAGADELPEQLPLRGSPCVAKRKGLVLRGWPLPKRRHKPVANLIETI